jgi:hypothetical protein
MFQFSGQVCFQFKVKKSTRNNLERLVVYDLRHFDMNIMNTILVLMKCNVYQVTGNVFFICLHESPLGFHNETQDLNPEQEDSDFQ